MARHAIWLNGKKVETGTVEVVRGAFEGGVLGEVCQAGAGEVEAGIAGMVRAFEELRGWASYKRAEVCRKVREGLVGRKEEFARMIAVEAGKPIRTARGEVDRAIMTMGLASEEATRIVGEQLPVDLEARGAGYWAMVERFAVGPCAFFTPFNFPLNLVIHKVGPALACGCPFVVKPSERTPLTALLLGEVLAGCGLPAGAWSVLPCDRGVASALVKDERVKLLSFTGSPEVGFKMKAEAGKKGVVLELGNNSAVVVEAETDLADAVPRIVGAAFGYAGQSCISVQRVYFHESIMERGVAMLVEGARKLVVGDPLEEKTDVGPMIDEAAAKRVEAWVKDSGGEVLCGGKREGNFYWPTVLRGVKAGTKLACEEVFGPVVFVESYGDFEEVIGRVNGTRYGLQAGIFSRDLHKVRRAFERLEMGGVVVNDVPTVRMDNMPYGGVKDSGFGREGVKYAMEHMTERRVMLVRGIRDK